MAIITIARDAFSGAKDLADYLSRAPGYKLVTRADVIAALPEYGISEERLDRALYKQLGIMPKMDLEWMHYLVCARAVLSREIDQGNLVYLGNDGGALLHGFPALLRLYVIGDMDHRVDVFMKRINYGVSWKEAEKFIKRMDAKRARWGKTLYKDGHFNLSDFDLVIDPRRMDIADAYSLIWTTVENLDYLPTPTSLETTECMSVAAELRARIALAADVADDKIEVTVHDGEIKITGSVRSPDEIGAIKKLLDTQPCSATLSLQH